MVLKRRFNGEIAYHLAVVVDDAHQGITHVTRGSDLFEATAIHVVLATLLDFKIPEYHHHKLIRDQNGQRLAKRDDARALNTYRQMGYSPNDVLSMIQIKSMFSQSGH